MTKLTSMTRPALTSGRNQCPSCGDRFKSNTGFDWHRTGTFGDRDDPRRCLTVSQMTAKGMTRDGAGFWITKAMNPPEG